VSEERRISSSAVGNDENGTAGKPLTLAEYLKELEGKKSGKPDQVRDGIEIYIGLWRAALEKSVVEASDDLETALRKVDAAGGLYVIAGEQPERDG